MEKKLHFIVGASGSGKSEHLFTKLIQKSLEHPEKNYILVVPEQFKLQIRSDHHGNPEESRADASVRCSCKH